MYSFWKTVIGTSVAAIVIVLILLLAVGGHSMANAGMQPALETGDRLMINKMAYHFNGPSRGEIISYKSVGSGTIELKRIIGLPGDLVEVINGAVFINGIRLTEPYVKNRGSYTLPPYAVPPASVFVLDDNRASSLCALDSCAVPQGNIIGRAWLVAWPPDNWGAVESYPLSSDLTSVQVP